MQIDNKGVLSQYSHRTILLYFDCSWNFVNLLLFLIYIKHQNSTILTIFPPNVNLIDQIS